jgi:hypothetical protein
MPIAGSAGAVLVFVLSLRNTDVKIHDNDSIMSDKIKMRDGDAILVMVMDGRVVHFSPNMSLPHAEFVKRTTRQLPEGAWVGTVSKLDGSDKFETFFRVSASCAS